MEREKVDFWKRLALRNIPEEIQYSFKRVNEFQSVLSMYHREKTILEPIIKKKHTHTQIN